MSSSAGLKLYCLDGVIERIRELEEESGSWAIGAEELRGLLGVEVGEFYRRIYAADREGHPLVGLASATESFSQDNIWEFVALAELFCGGAAERRLEEAGVFFSHPEQLELMGTFVAAASQAVREHTVDPDQFSAMLRTFGGFERACRCYLDEHFHLGELVEAAARRHCRTRRFGIPALALRNACALLGCFFQKHVLEPGDLFAGVRARLFDQAVREGFAEPWGAERSGAGRPGAAAAGSGGRPFRAPAEPSPLERARRALGLEGRPLSPALLKSQYKRLIKHYHPDVNPAGLQRCQEINAAYALILSVL